MPPSLILQTLSSSNTLNYIQPTPNQHIPHALSKKSSILQNRDNPYINQYPSQSTSAQPIRISILHIHTGIINMHGLMPFSYKRQIITILGSFIFITPWNLQISLFGSSNGEIILVLILTSSKTIPWLKTDISISNKIFNLLLQKGSFIPFSFSV